MHLRAELMAVLSLPTGRTAAGWPFLARPAWTRLRDWVPHVLGAGLEVWEVAANLERELGASDALQVVRQVVRTAAITAPPDLWLLRQVLSALRHEGWLDRLAEGLHEVPSELEPEITLLLGRGYLVRQGAGYRWSDDPTPQRVLAELPTLPPDRPTDLSARWAAAFRGDDRHDALLVEVAADPPVASPHPPPAWIATPEDLELGYRLVPLVLGMRESGVSTLPDRPVGRAARQVLQAAGWLDAGGQRTPIGHRGFQRGSGPFGIIETYHPYVAALPRIWREGRAAVHVERAANVAASQDANRRTFERANDALDRFCADTGFTYRLFVEHAVGRGEASRQRYARSGDDLAYVGADLEQAAIAEARAEQASGRLPAEMRFVQADIGDPGALAAALREADLDPEGAVMVVGNGFHEVRGQSDERMVEVFRGYEALGIVLLFTEESALAVDDLLRTAWNTYHAGFRYVHERSGQGLRPSGPRPDPGLGPPLRASWTECATRAGYVRASRWCWRSRRIYPYTPANGHNPSVSVNHFFVPERLARRLGDLADPLGSE